MTTTTAAADHLLRAKAAELAWHPVHRNVDEGKAVTALVKYAEDALGRDLDREEAHGFLAAEITTRPIYKPARHPDEITARSLAQSLLNAEASARDWLAHQMMEAEREGNVIRAMTLRQVRAELAVLGLISGH